MSGTGATNIPTEPLAAPFTRGGLRCNRMVFDFTDQPGREFNLTWIVGGPNGCITLNLLREPLGSSWSAHPFEVRLADGKYWLPVVVARHTPRQIHDYDVESGPCQFLDGLPCYGDSSGMLANDIMEEAVKRNSEEFIWDVLIATHHAWIENAEDADETELASPLEGPEHPSD